MTMMEDELTNLRQENSQLKGLLLGCLKKPLKLEDLPSDLLDDLDFVLEAVKANSAAWYNLPQKWKDNAEVAMAAFEASAEDPFSNFGITDFSSDPYLSWYHLPYHLKMNKDVLSHALKTQNGPKWEKIPIQFQTNQELMVTALLYGKIKFEDVPSDLQRNHRDVAFFGVQEEHIRADDCPCLTPEFLKDALENGKLDWNLLPIDLQTDVDFAMSISRFNGKHPFGKSLLEQMLDHVEEIRGDRFFWLKLLDSHEKEFYFKNMLQKYAPQELFSDRDFMIKACQVCTDAWSLVDEGLASEYAFFEAMLGQNPAVLKFMSHEMQQQHRDLLLKTLPALGQLKDDHCMSAHDASKAIFPAFWLQYGFAIAWVKAGLGFPQVLSGPTHRAWCNNRALCLATAVESNSLYYAGKFTSEVSFMQEVLEHKPDFYYEAKGAAATDPVILTMAFAAAPELAGNKMLELHLQGQDDVIDRYRTSLRSMLAFRCVLGNMLSTQSVADTGTPLTLLNQGLETSSKYKRLLAEYLDIPTGKWLRCLLQADRNFKKAIAPWTADA